MSDTPKFEVIDRRKIKAEEEQDTPRHYEPPEPGAGPRLVVPEPKQEPEPEAAPVVSSEAVEGSEPELPPAPTAQESNEQKAAYDASTQRLEDLVRAQNPAAGPQPPVTFEFLVQQLYLSAMIQMGAGAQEGQRPRVDILGARQSIDLLAILAEKTRGNLNQAENRMLDTVLFEARMAFLELTSMISMQGMQPPPPSPVKR